MSFVPMPRDELVLTEGKAGMTVGKLHLAFLHHTFHFCPNFMLMKRLAIAFAFGFSSICLGAQTSDPVLDSLKRPLPKNASPRQQVERLRGILWHIFRAEETPYETLPAQLDSLYRCCIAEKTGDARYEKAVAAEVIFFKGNALLFEDPVAAKLLMEASVLQFQRLKDSANMAFSYSGLCSIASAMGDSLAFAKNYDRANSLSHSIKDPFSLGFFHNSLGIGCYDFGRYAEAAGHYFEALALIEKYPTREMLDAQRDVFHNLGGVYSRLGDYENAMIYAQKAIESSKQTGQDPSDHFAQLSWVYAEKKRLPAGIGGLTCHL